MLWLGSSATTLPLNDRDSIYGAVFDRRVRNLGISQVRTPFRSPRANAIAERWLRSVRTECLDHLFIFDRRQLQKVLADYLDYFNHWRPHRSIGQRAPCPSMTPRSHGKAEARQIVAKSVLGGLHHVYQPVA
jgi:putative transposase